MLAGCLQTGDAGWYVSYEFVFQADAKYSPPDDRIIVVVHLVARDFLIIKGEDQEALLPEVLANADVNIGSGITTRHTS